MGVKNKYFEAKTYYYKVLTLCILVVVDILFNSFTQFINFGIKVQDYTCQVDDIYLCSGLALFEFLLIMVMVFVLLNIFSETYYFKRGYLGAICGKFAFDLIFLLLYPIIFLIERIIFGIRLNDLKDDIDPPATVKIWTSPYLVLYILKYLASFLFYVGILRTSFELGKTEYYKSQALQN